MYIFFPHVQPQYFLHSYIKDWRCWVSKGSHSQWVSEAQFKPNSPDKDNLKQNTWAMQFSQVEPVWPGWFRAMHQDSKYRRAFERSWEHQHVAANPWKMHQCPETQQAGQVSCHSVVMLSWLLPSVHCSPEKCSPIQWIDFYSFNLIKTG